MYYNRMEYKLGGVPLMRKSGWWIGSLILLVTLLWGYAWVLMKIGLQYMGPFTFSAFRFGIGSITLLVITSFRKTLVPRKEHIPGLIVVGVLQTTLVFLFVMYGMRFVEAGKSSVLLYSMPIWTSLLAHKFLDEALELRKMIGIVFGSAGLLLIVGWDVLATQNRSMIIGESLIVLAALFWAMANVYVKKRFAQLDKIQLTTSQMTFGTVGIILAALLMEWGEPIVLHPISVFAILFTGILASSLCFTVWFYVLTVIDTTTAAISMMLVPVFGLLFSWLTLNEPFTIQVLIGSLFILIGIAQTAGQQTKKHRAMSTPQTTDPP